MRNNTKEVFSFRTLVSKIRNYLIKKLNIHNLHQAQLWDWREGAKETLNPIPAMIFTLKNIWRDEYCWIGGTWINDAEMNPSGITKDMKLNFLSKCHCSWIYVFSSIFSKYGFSWRYGDGLGRYGYTTFKWWLLTYYRTHTYWLHDKFEEKWKEKKFLFSNNWKKYEQEYFIHCSHGTWEKEVSEEKFQAELEKWEDC
jgi:hypothetical protein